MSSTGHHLLGILLAGVIGVSGYFASAWSLVPINAILLALLLGVLVGNLMRLPFTIRPGVAFTSGRLLEVSILFLAFGINFTHIAVLGMEAFGIVALVVFAMVLITWRLATAVRCPGTTGWLVGFGTAICGSSAIAALAPVVTKNKEDVGIAMAVVNLFGSLGMIVLPMLLMELDLDPVRMGLLLGGTLHSVGNVVGAGYAIDNAVGEAAVTIKLARVALISPALILFNVLVNHGRVERWQQHFRLPWYLWGFVVITIIGSLTPLPPELVRTMGTIGQLALTIAMAAIGLQVSFGELYRSGRKGLGFGLIIFTIQLCLVAGLMWLH